MRLGGPIYKPYQDPEAWASAVKEKGYRAAYCPVDIDKVIDYMVVQDYADAARKADIVIAEVGTWNNPLSPDEAVSKAALEKCKKGLNLAERIGARCCVNIAGSRGAKWDGPNEADLTKETFEMIVAIVREIIDSVKPKRTFFTLETMPWMYPDSADSYLRLLKAVNRKAFAVHLDVANLICSPQRYFQNGALIRECFEKLGPEIKSCHAKDIILRDVMTTHLDETRPGLGHLEYRTLLNELNKLDSDISLMMEHLTEEKDYDLAAAYIRSVASMENIVL